MIHRTHRFHGRTSLRFVYSRGQTVRNQYLALRFVSNPRRKTYRVAVVVSRKVHKSAVVRNRIRRRIYEVVRARDAAVTDAYDMVFTVFSEQLADMPFEQLQQNVSAQLQKARITPFSSEKHGIVDGKGA